MTSQMEELQQRVASFVETAYEAGYDEAADKAYAFGFEDGKEEGRREGFEEALAVVETTRDAFVGEDPGDECDCEICNPTVEEFTLTGEYARDVKVLLRVVNVLSENGQALESNLDRLVASLDGWAPGVGDVLGALADQVVELEERTALAEADALLVESVDARLRALEAFAQQTAGYTLPTELTVEPVS